MEVRLCWNRGGWKRGEKEQEKEWKRRWGMIMSKDLGMLGGGGVMVKGGKKGMSGGLVM